MRCAPFLACGALLAACDGGGGAGGGGAGGSGPETLPLPAGAAPGDELVAEIVATSVDGSWGDAANQGLILTLQAGANGPRNAFLPGGFAQETKVSLGAWDGGDVTLEALGTGSFEVTLAVDPAAADLPVMTLYAGATNDDVPLLVFRSGDMLEYVMTNENGGTGFLPTLLVAQWGRPHDIEGLFDVAAQTYQGKDHVTLDFTGPFEGTHPLLRQATNNGLVAPADPASAVLWHVSPVPVDFTLGPGEPREKVMDPHPWLFAAGWQEVVREGKVSETGGPMDDLLGGLGAYVFLDYDLGAGVKASFEAEVDGAFWSSLGIFAGATGITDARSSGVGRTAIELPPGKTVQDVTSVRVVWEEGAGTLQGLRTFSYDASTYVLVERGALGAPVALDGSSPAIDLPGL